MDIVNHAIAGAAAGTAFGNPILGAIFAIIPDLVLGRKRLAQPSIAYNLTHSLPFLLTVGFISSAIFGTPLPLIALLSHLILDLPTHGKEWAPPLFYPYSNKRYSFGEEWEWFNPSWWRGLAFTIVWSVAWLCV